MRDREGWVEDHSPSQEGMIDIHSWWGSVSHVCGGWVRGRPLCVVYMAGLGYSSRGLTGLWPVVWGRFGLTVQAEGGVGACSAGADGLAHSLGTEQTTSNVGR